MLARLVLSALLGCLLLALGAGSASAAVRYAAPGAGGAEPCNPAPCAIVKAVNGAAAGDRVIVAPGQYLVGADLQIDAAVDVGGEPGKAPPSLGLADATVRVADPNAVLHDVSLFMTQPAMAFTLSLEGGTVERIRSEGDQGAGACIVQRGLLRDALCFDDLFVHPAESGLAHVTLRNVTAVPLMIGAGFGSRLELDAANVIAYSPDDVNKDLEVNVSSGASMVATFAHSNFATVGTTLSAGTEYTYTAPGTGTNQTSRPRFVDAAAGDFRPAADSPTIDAGLPDGLIGSLALGGEPRSLPSCIGGAPVPDIGAYEFVPTVECPKPSNAIRLGKLRRRPAKGTALLTVAVPGPGTLSLAGKGLRVRKPRPVGGPGKPALLIAAKGRWKRVLDRRGAVKVRARITFLPTGGEPRTLTRQIRLLKAPPKSPPR